MTTKSLTTRSERAEIRQAVVHEYGAGAGRFRCLPPCWERQASYLLLMLGECQRAKKPDPVLGRSVVEAKRAEQRIGPWRQLEPGDSASTRGSGPWMPLGRRLGVNGVCSMEGYTDKG